MIIIVDFDKKITFECNLKELKLQFFKWSNEILRRNWKGFTSR